ncbi:MAG: ATPase domain-containing protein [Candidatus Altiarchaeota archaeon]
MMVERVPTGIPGLDDLLGGGFVKRRHVIICGGPGSGKTTLLYEFLYRGAAQYNDKGLFISLEQSPERVVKGAKALFGSWDWEKYLSTHIAVTRVKIDDFNHLQDIIGNYVEEHGVKRVVLDSLTLLRLYFRGDDAYRNNLYELLTYLGDLDCTTLLALEKSANKRSDAKFDMEEFVADGVINMYLIPKERDRLRVLEIIKMRDTNHSTRLCPFKITSDGMMISPDAQMFGDVE